MSRRRLTQEERKQETRQLLLESARETFAQLGFHGASVDKIAEFAGFTKGAVYAHFSSKEKLFLALLEQQTESHVRTIHKAMDEQYSFDHLIKTMDHYFELDRQKNRTWSILNIEFLLYAMRDESMRQKWTDMIVDSVKQISEVIEKVIPENDLCKQSLSAEELAWSILSLENGAAIFYYITEDRMPINLYEKAMENILQPYRDND